MNHIPELASSTPCKCVNKSCNVEQRGRRDPDQRILKAEDSGTHVSGPDPSESGGREGTRTPDFLVANDGENKLRRGATIT